MEITKIGKIGGGQDGAIFGHELFRLHHKGGCAVYDLAPLKDGGDPVYRTSFSLGSLDLIVPHCNAVCFGTEYYAEGDEFPLLYSNVYNNYASADNKRIGECCVYRLVREGASFRADLVQLIAIGFCEDATLWKASPDAHGVRPYANFLVDTATRSYYAYVMRNEEKGTRFFRFDLPSVQDGEIDPVLGVRRVVLMPEDIRASFDLPFFRFIQGGIIEGGILYSTEGFSNSEQNPPAIRTVDLAKGSEVYYHLPSLGINEEPEMIDFMDGVCYYSDAYGNLFTVTF